MVSEVGHICGRTAVRPYDIYIQGDNAPTHYADYFITVQRMS